MTVWFLNVTVEVLDRLPGSGQVVCEAHCHGCLPGTTFSACNCNIHITFLLCAYHSGSTLGAFLLETRNSSLMGGFGAALGTEALAFRPQGSSTHSSFSTFSTTDALAAASTAACTLTSTLSCSLPLHHCHFLSPLSIICLSSDFRDVLLSV